MSGDLWAQGCINKVFRTSCSDSDILTLRSFRRTEQTAECCSAGRSPDPDWGFSWFSVGHGLPCLLAVAVLAEFPAARVYVLKRGFPCCWHVPEPQMHTTVCSHSFTCLLFAHCCISTPLSVSLVSLGDAQNGREVADTLTCHTKCLSFRVPVISVRCLIRWYCLSETVLTMVTMATSGSKSMDYYLTGKSLWVLNQKTFIGRFTFISLSMAFGTLRYVVNTVLRVVTPCSLVHLPMFLKNLPPYFIRQQIPSKRR